MRHVHSDIDFCKPMVMSIVNVTPDSFYRHSFDEQSVELSIRQAVEQGAAIIDIGGCSTRPGADCVSQAQEIERVMRGVECARRIAPDVALSIDTFRSSVIRTVVEQSGWCIVNDISAARLDPEIGEVAARYDLPFVAMHSRGTPATMQSMTDYRGGVVEGVYNELAESIERLRKQGVKRIVADPGFGFAKTTEQNWQLVAGIGRLRQLGCPILAGVSRKSMLYRMLDTTPDKVDAAMAALNWELLRGGVSILRVHDTASAVQIVRMYDYFNRI